MESLFLIIASTRVNTEPNTKWIKTNLEKEMINFAKTQEGFKNSKIKEADQDHLKVLKILRKELLKSERICSLALNKIEIINHINIKIQIEAKMIFCSQELFKNN